MAITLAPETEQLIEQKLQECGYQSVDELIRNALHNMNALHSGLDEQTLDAIDEAEDQIERGEVFEWEDVKKHLQERIASKRAST